MALVTSNISGSNSRIGITGSVVIGDASQSAFPTIGSDAVFYVSGSETAKSVFGGAAKISGSLSTDGNVVLGNSIDDTITVTGAAVFQSSTTFNAGLSGSITKLPDGSSYIVAGENVTITTGSNGSITITAASGGTGGGSGDITSVTASTGLTGGGTSGDVTLTINDSVVATVSGSTFTGVTKHAAGLSGSLTKLTDGSSYLVAGSNVVISTGSNGAVTISSTASDGGTTTDTGWTVTGGSYTQAFSYVSGTVQTFTVPIGVTSISAYVWGAGGGNGSYASYYGGAGGFASGSITVTPGDTLYLVVGGGGYPSNGASGNGGLGGWPNAGFGTRGDASGGGGGGYSGIFSGSSTPQQVNALLLAGGGGGGTGYKGGGGGGGTSGNAGGSGGNPGQGGTQVAGGTAGNGDTNPPRAGGALTGGNAGGTGQDDPNTTGVNDGGGGGSGYFGGGGGASDGSGGGGGSGYYNPTKIIGGSLQVGSDGQNNAVTNPAQTSNQYYVTGIATGSAPGNKGGDGYILLTYTTGELITYTTASVGVGVSSVPSDSNFFVSGTIGGSKKAVFSGDLRVSGSLTVGTGSITLTSNNIQFGDESLRIERGSSNSIRFVVPAGGKLDFAGIISSSSGLTGSLTKLADGTSYLIAGSGVSITTGSSGAITIASDAVASGDITAVTAGTGLTGGGTSGDVTLNINDSIVATISGSTFTGAISSPGITSTAGLTQSGGDVSLAAQTNGTVNIGNNSGTTTTAILGGTSVILSGAVGTNYTIGGETGTGTITIGRSNATNYIEIGNASFTGVGRIQYINIGTNASSWGTALISIGSISSLSNTTIAAGSTLALTGSTVTSYIIGGQGQTGTITLGRSTASNTISIGSAGNNAANTQTVQIGAGTGVSAVTIGSTTGASAVALKAGTGGLTVTGASTFNNGVSVTGSLGASTLTVLSGVLYQANGTIQQDANLVWDADNDRLGLGTASPAARLHIGNASGPSFRIGQTNSYVELNQHSANVYKWIGGGTVTQIEQNVNQVYAGSVKVGFNSTNAATIDAAFNRAAAGIINVSGSAPGALFRFNATSTPLAAGDLGMDISTGRPTALIGGAARSLAHTSEVALLTGATFSGNVGVTGSLGASNLSIAGGVLYQSNGVIQQSNNLVWDNTNTRLGVGISGRSPSANIETGPDFRVGVSSTAYVNYSILGAPGTYVYRVSSAGITHQDQTLETRFPNSKCGFSSGLGQEATTAFRYAAPGVLSISGSAPGALFRFNASSTPLAAGDLGMDVSTGRPTAFIGGAARSLAHTSELAPVGASYVVLSSDSTLTSERILAAGSGISITDGGAGGTVTIAATGGGGGSGGTSYFDSTTAGSIFTSGSAAFKGDELVSSPRDKGSDVFFYVSGSSADKTLFGGDVRISGSLTVGTGSITITSNNVQFGSSANRIELINNGSDLKFVDSSNPNGRTLSNISDLVLIESKYITSDTQTIVFSNLDGNVDRNYYIFGRRIQGVNTTSYEVRPNQLTSNLYAVYHYVYSNGATVGHTAANYGTTFNWGGSIAASSYGIFEMVFHAESSKPRWFDLKTVYSVPSANAYNRLEVFGRWNDSTTNLTSLELRGSAVDTFISGTEFHLYKLRRG